MITPGQREIMGGSQWGAWERETGEGVRACRGGQGRLSQRGPETVGQGLLRKQDPAPSIPRITSAGKALACLGSPRPQGAPSVLQCPIFSAPTSLPLSFSFGFFLPFLLL